MAPTSAHKGPTPPFLLSFLPLLLFVAWGQPDPADPTNGTAPGTTTTTPEDQIVSQLAPYAAAIGGVIAALGVILGR
jgi:hypothetical protein